VLTSACAALEVIFLPSLITPPLQAAASPADFQARLPHDSYAGRGEGETDDGRSEPEVRSRMPVLPARRVYRVWTLDSRRWDHYRPRAGDVVIATYPKCGTTWMQRIVDLLVFQTPEARPVVTISPWLDRRFPEPVEAVTARLEAQDHRRFLKAHLPADGLPLFDEVRYIHVARDGRDACLSYHNHGLGLTAEMLAGLDRAGLEDETIARPYPRIPADPAAYFHRWLTEGAAEGEADGTPFMSFFNVERSWWEVRHRPGVLLVHYDDMQADLAHEMRRVADFLGIAVPAEVWPALVEAAGFGAMRRDGAVLIDRLADIFEGGSRRFFHKATKDRWRGLFRGEDLFLYEAKAGALLAPDCARWVAGGRSGAAEGHPGGDDPRGHPSPPVDTARGLT
jgi:aryl sulfotransferase